MYSDIAFEASKNLGIIVCGFFCFIMLFGESRDRIHSVLIFVFSIAVYLLPEITSQYGSNQYLLDYKTKSALLIGISCLAAISFVPALPLDQKAWIHASVFLFIIFFRVIIFHKLTAPHFAISNFVWIWYYELLIIISLIQIAISYDAFLSSLGRIRNYLHGSDDCGFCNDQDSFSFEEVER